MSNCYPCCGLRALGTMPGSYTICPVCFQEGNGLQFAPPAMAGGANKVSLTEASAITWITQLLEWSWTGHRLVCTPEALQSKAHVLNLTGSYQNTGR